MAVAVGRCRDGVCLVKIKSKHHGHIHIQLNANAVIVMMFVEFNAAVCIVLLGGTAMVVRVLRVMVMIMRMLMKMIMRNSLSEWMMLVRHGSGLNGAERQ